MLYYWVLMFSLLLHGCTYCCSRFSLALKNKVLSYILANDVVSANRLITSNTSFDPDYVIGVLTPNLP